MTEIITEKFLRREELKPSSKLRARYGVYVNGRRVGAVGLTRKGYWWPIYNGKLYSKILFGSRDEQANVVVKWATKDGGLA